MSKFKLTAEAVATYRPFAIALGQAIANTKVTDYKRMEMMLRHYKALRPADKMRCLTEMDQCKLARRGELEARVA